MIVLVVLERPVHGHARACTCKHPTRSAVKTRPGKDPGSTRHVTQNHPGMARLTQARTQGHTRHPLKMAGRGVGVAGGWAVSLGAGGGGTDVVGGADHDAIIGVGRFLHFVDCLAIMDLEPYLSTVGPGAFDTGVLCKDTEDGVIVWREVLKDRKLVADPVG